MISPLIVAGRRIVQTLCRSGIDWDDPLPLEMKKCWSEWKASLVIAEKVSIKRQLSSRGGTEKRYEIHHFADATLSVYATVSYIRVIHPDGNIEVSFLYGKTRVAPRKSVSIVRLELTGCVLMVRIGHSSGPYIRTFFWTDSQTALRYLVNEDTRFKIFVANRVAQLRENTEIGQWGYIETRSNPADDGSRARQTKRWVEGPEFLSRDTLPPQWRPPKGDLPPDDPEVSLKVMATRVTLLDSPQPLDNPLIKFISHFHI